MMSLPQDLISTATIGTNQRELSHQDLPLLDQLDPTDREKTVLVAAALYSIQAQAGWLIQHDPRPLPEPAEKESGKMLHPEAIQYLIRTLREGEYLTVLSEWLSEAAKIGRRVPEEALPLLLDEGRRSKTLGDKILPLLGRRGFWLAEQAKQWDWCLPHNLEKVWGEGSSDTRIQVIEQLRKTDPAKARELVETIWSTLKAEVRAEIIELFSLGLSGDDEAFLESALDDKAQGVRYIAAHLLHFLPDSQFQKRMKARTLPLIDYRDKRLRFNLPDQLDQAALRDGFMEIESADQETRKKWLFKMLTAIPPVVWRDLWGLTSQGLIVAAMNSEDSLKLLDSWLTAAFYANDVEFAALLLPTLFELNANKEGSAAYSGLIAKLPSDAFETMVVEHLNKAMSPTHFGVRSLLHVAQSPWSEKMTLALLDNLRRYLKKGNVQPDAQLRDDLLRYALYMPVSMREKVIQVLDVPTISEKYWKRMVEDIHLLLEFRAEMLAAIHR